MTQRNNEHLFRVIKGNEEKWVRLDQVELKWVLASHTFNFSTLPRQTIGQKQESYRIGFDIHFFIA